MRPSNTDRAPESSRSPSRLLVKQGAEAVSLRYMRMLAEYRFETVYKSTFLETTRPCAIKCRVAKSYRLPALDSKLTRQRCMAEARLLMKGRRAGLACPVLYYLDEWASEIWMEWIDGESVRSYLAKENQIDTNVIGDIMKAIGRSIGKMHEVDIIHGDLTTSNILIREAPQCNNVFIIDFGLGFSSTLEEDKAVDLYVLERALQSTYFRADEMVTINYKRRYSNMKDVRNSLSLWTSLCESSCRTKEIGTR